MNGLLRKLLELLRPGRLDDDTVDELSHHVEVLVAGKVAQGLDAREARRQALVEVGSVASAREQVAEARTGFALEQLAREVRYAARAIRRSPGLSLLSIATMGMGIGVGALLVTLISAIVLRPLPYPQADRLVRIFDTNPAAGIDRTGVTTGNVADWRGRTTAFDGIAAYYEMGRTVAFDGDADVLMTAQVSEDFFDILRVGPAIGRTFTPDEVRRATFSSAAAPTGADPVVVLSHRVWMRRFNGDPAAIGRTFLLERRQFKVIGVMPPVFAMPDAGVELWIPWSIVSDGARDPRALISQVRAVLKKIDPLKPPHGVYPLRDLLGDTYARDRQVTMTLSLFACAAIALALMSVYGVLAQRVRERSQEIGIRMALGADARNVVGWVAGSGLRLIATGLALGVLVARGLAGALDRLLFEVAATDPLTTMLVVGLVAGVGAMASLVPAWRATRIDPVRVLRGA